MGQQQLLLLVIGVVLVGIAVMAGFYAFNVKFRQNLADSLVERNLTIASEAIAWKTRTDPYRGNNADYKDLEDGGMEKLFLGERTVNGCHKFTTANGQQLVISAQSVRHTDVGIRTYVTGEKVDSTRVFFDGSITLTCETEVNE